jgi:hypothetical protein
MISNSVMKFKGLGREFRDECFQLASLDFDGWVFELVVDVLKLVEGVRKAFGLS